MMIMASHFTEVIQRYSRNICTAPGCYLAVTMFTYYKCVDTSVIYAQMLTQ